MPSTSNVSFLTDNKRIIAPLSALFVAAAILTGCQRPAFDREQAFAVRSELFAPGDYKHSLERDGYGRMEVLNAATSGRVVSILFVEAYENAVISDVGLFPRIIIKGWQALNGKAIEFGLKGTAETPRGTVKFERFSFEGNACFHFHSLYQPSFYADQGGYSKLVAGYFCHNQADPLPDIAVARFLGSISVPKFNFVEVTDELSPNHYYQPVSPLKTRATNLKP